VRPVRVWPLSDLATVFPVSITVALKAFNRLCSDIRSHYAQLWRFGYCAGLYHTATSVGHKSVRFSLNFCRFTDIHQAIAFTGDYTSLTVFPIAFDPEMSHDFNSLNVEDLCMHRRQLCDRNSFPLPDKFDSFSFMGFPYWSLFGDDDIDYRVRPTVRRC
jgi:hypothetical protein